MTALDIIRRLQQHRQWSNARLLQAARQLSENQLRQSFPIGQGTIWSTLTHLYAAEYVWLEAMLGNENPVTPGDVPGKLPGNQQSPDAASSLDELQDRWHQLNDRWATYLEQLTDDSLSDIVSKISSLTGERGATRRSDILIHVCTHAQYTTAQAINMMRHCGLDKLPDPMMISLAREEGSGKRTTNEG